MRVGQNPIKSVETIAPPSTITVVVISYIPFLSGYYEQSLDVFRLCLNSLRVNTKEDFDLLVFDNGSCQEARNFLIQEQEKGSIQYLFLSERNLGKPQAWNIALTAAPGEYIAYADSDVCFYPGWLPASLKALRQFPEIGMVTAMPILTPKKYSTKTIKWAKRKNKLKIEHGQVIQWSDFWRHARSLGDTEEKARKFYDQNDATKISLKQEDYFVGAAHFQFTAPKTVLKALLPIPADRPMGRVRLFDEAMDNAGYLRLCIAKWYVQHLGNRIPAESDLAAPLGITTQRQNSRRRYSGLWRLPIIRRFLQWLYGWSFNRLHRTK
jgi:glycosyltransferase involved in cell wall biosynthesis